MSVPSEKKAELAEALITNILLWKNPYDIFDAKPDTPLDDIHRKYKKISLQIHPDKCKLPKAEEAFHALKKALGILKDDEHEELRKTYHKIMEKSRDKVRELWRDQGKVRRTKDDDKAFEKDVKRMSQKIILDIEANNARAEELKMANERREKEQKFQEQELAKKEIEHEEKWEKSRDYRVDSWRTFQSRTTKKRKAPEDDIANLEPADALSIATPTNAETKSTKAAKLQVPKPFMTPTLKPEPLILPPKPPVVIPKPVEVPKPAPKPATSPNSEPIKVIPLLGESKKKKYAPKPLKPPKIKLS